MSSFAAMAHSGLKNVLPFLLEGGNFLAGRYETLDP